MVKSILTLRIRYKLDHVTPINHQEQLNILKISDKPYININLKKKKLLRPTGRG